MIVDFHCHPWLCKRVKTHNRANTAIVLVFDRQSRKTGRWLVQKPKQAFFTLGEEAAINFDTADWLFQVEVEKFKKELEGKIPPGEKWFLYEAYAITLR